jgi:DNA-nicking Smr family endonuclease
VTDDEVEYFRRLVSGARPLKSSERVPEPKKRPAPRARFSRADEEKALEESLEVDIDTMEAANAESIRYHRPHVGKRTMRKLARGKYAVQAEIDLHGMTVAEARPRLADFIDYSIKQGLTCVRIVHGKGLGSGHRGPVLKNAVNRWLRKWDSVLAFVSARQVDGGTGAVYVLLDASEL